MKKLEFFKEIRNFTMKILELTDASNKSTGWV